MELQSNHNVESITIVLFKDNLASRTFQVSLCWIRRISWILLSLVMVTLLSLIGFLHQSFALRRIASSTPLETNQLSWKDPSPLASFDTSELDTPLDSSSLQEKSKTSNLPFFQAFPEVFKSYPPQNVNLAIQKPTLHWSKNYLRVQFTLEHLKTDQVSQQGYILILARGPALLLSYPASTLNPAGSSFLLNPQQGEPFSVARFRSVKADFGPIMSPLTPNMIEIFIFNKESELLIYQQLQPSEFMPEKRS